MDGSISDKHHDLTGAILGAVTGFLFALAAWGVDMLITSLGHGLGAWAKGPVGIVAAVLTGALAGFLTARASRLLAIISIWVGWGGLMSLIASLLPFQYQNAVIAWIRPLLRQEILYPTPEFHGRRLFLSLVITAGLMFIVAIFFSNLVDTIAANVHIGASALSVAAVSVIFILFGVSLDSIYNRPFRSAVSITHETIELARANPDALESGKESSEMGLLGVRTIEGILDRPYSMVVKSYDTSLESIQVLVDFDGFWYECSVNNNTVYYCK